MIIFACLKKEFDDYVSRGIISNKVYDAYKERMGKKTKLNQIKAWANSLPFMKYILKDLQDNVGIAIEFNIPLTSKRVDFVVSAYNNNKEPVMLIFELKQWEKVFDVKGEDAIIKTKISNKEKRLLHPSYQVLGYQQLLNNYNKFVEDNKVKIIPLVYLHNYSFKNDDVLLLNKFKKYYNKALMYDKDSANSLKELVNNNICYGDDLEIIRMIDKSDVKPNKKLV